MNVENGIIQLNIPNGRLERAVRGLRSVQQRFPLAVARAANRTMYGMGTDAARETSKRYFVKSGDVKKSIEYRKATAGNLMGAMISKGKRHSLADYQLTPSAPKPGGKTQLKGAVKRAGGLKSLKHGFLVRRAGGKYFPFYRIGYDSEHRQRGEIRSYISPSMPQIIKNEEIVEAIQQGAEERFAKRIEAEIFYILEVLPR